MDLDRLETLARTFVDDAQRFVPKTENEGKYAGRLTGLASAVLELIAEVRASRTPPPTGENER